MKVHGAEKRGLIQLQILEDYGSQLSHLTKELSLIQKDYEAWDQSTTGDSETWR